MRIIKKLFDIFVVVGLVFCLFGAVVFSSGGNMSIDFFQFPFANIANHSGITVGVHTEIENTEPNKKPSVSMAIYTDKGVPFGNASLCDSYYSNGKLCETRIIELPIPFLGTDFNLVIDSTIGLEQKSITKEFKLDYGYTSIGNFNFIEKPHIEEGLLKCSWTPVENANSYDVYMSDDFAFYYTFSKLVATTDTPSLLIEPREIQKSPNDNYRIVVVAKSSFNNISRIECSFNETLPTQMHESDANHSYKFSICGYTHLDVPPEANNKYATCIVSLGSSINSPVEYSGYFSMPIVPKKSSPYNLEIRNDYYPYFLNRYIKNIDLKSDIQIGTKDSPILLWPGDFNRDDSINMADIMIMAKEFGLYDPNGYLKADIDKDKYVTIKDIMLVAPHFNMNSDDYPLVEIISPPQYNIAKPLISRY